MERKKASFNKIKGMVKDVSESKIPSDFAYDIHNLRLVCNEDNTMYSLVTEKGPSSLGLDIEGTPLGYCVLNNIFVIFSHDENAEIPDYITRFTYNSITNSIFKNWTYNGNLGFDLNHKIEAVGSYETEDIQKVYWVDGKNPNRIINIAPSDIDYPNRISSSLFDFIPELELKEEVSITKSDFGGEFAPGVIQYAFCYYNQYMQQTRLAYISPLNYITHHNRGGKADENVNCSFTIEVKNIDTKFDYLRLYSIHRTTENGDIIFTRLVDYRIDQTNDYTDYISIFTDSGREGISEDATFLYYIGGEDLIASTINIKSNRMYVGNIVYNNFDDLSELQKPGRFTFNFGRRLVEYSSLNKQFYNYESNLYKGEDQNKFFKGGEWYRIGIQFQNKAGKWSDVVYLGDYKNPYYPALVSSSDSKTMYNLPKAFVTIYKGTKILLKSYGYKSARIVMALPVSSFKSILAQGVLCPTLYYIRDRLNNNPHCVSSWYMRGLWEDNNPNNFLEFRHNYPLKTKPTLGVEIRSANNLNILPTVSSQHFDNIDDNKYEGGLWIITTATALGPFKFELMIRTKAPYAYDSVVFQSDTSYLSKYDKKNKEVAYNEVIDKYLKSDYRNYKFYIPPLESFNKNPERFDGKFFKATYMPPDATKYSDDNQNNDYFVDQSIVTFHSPDLEDFSGNDYSDLSLRIVGVTSIKNTLTDSYIKANGTVDEHSEGYLPIDIYNEGARINGLVANDVWEDSEYSPVNSDNNSYTKGQSTIWRISTWSDAYLGNYDKQMILSEGIGKFGKLEKKIFANYRFCNTTCYFNDCEIDPNKNFSTYNLHNVNILNETEDIAKIRGSYLNDLNYKSNVDSILNPKVSYSAITTLGINSPVLNPSPIPIKYKSPTHAVFALYDSNDNTAILPKYTQGSKTYNEFTRIDDSGYAVFPWSGRKKLVIELAGVFDGAYTDNNLPVNSIILCNRQILYGTNVNGVYAYYILVKDEYDADTNTYTFRPLDLSIDRNEVFVYKGNGVNADRYFKTISSEDNPGSVIRRVVENYPNFSPTQEMLDYVSTLDSSPLYTQESIESTINYSKYLHYGLLYIAELYRDCSSETIYGSKDNLLNNTWIPISNSVALDDDDNITYIDAYGDTYFMRWDCLKTYPYTEEDINSVVDVTSFLVETSVNIDGRTDKNRGTDKVTAIRPTNFNLDNSVYNQLNNVFSYKVPNKTNIKSFNNSIAISLVKSVGEDYDPFCNVTLGSSITLDTEHGNITGLYNIGENLFVMQDTAISRLLIDANYQVATDLNVPIEISSSEHIKGYDYISKFVGSRTGLSCATPEEVIFIDTNTRELYALNSESKLLSLSRSLGINNWAKNSEVTKILYDGTNDDVLFITDNISLTYSRTMSSFSSFYDYRDKFLINVLDKSIWLHSGTPKVSLWMHNNGSYNTFFNELRPYSLTVIANDVKQEDSPISLLDKVFDTIDFRADVLSGEVLSVNPNTFYPNLYPFDTIRTWNEYQDSLDVPLTQLVGRPSSLKQKFRIWRVTVPRNNGTRDRMRNPWLYITLANNNPTNNKTIIHSIDCNYYE